MALIGRLVKWFCALIAALYIGMVVFAYWPTEAGVPAESLATADDIFIDVNGMRLRYREWGTPVEGQPSLVLIHGFANSVQTFRSLAPALETDYHVLALDMPGFGLSDKPTDHNYSNTSQASIVAGFIKALNLPDVVVGGHSMGGRLALDTVLQVPEARGTILLNPGIFTTGVPAITEYLKFPFPRMSAKMFAGRDFRESFLKNAFVHPEIVTQDVVDAVMLGPQTDDYYTGVTTMMGYYETGDEDALLAQIRVPNLIVWGVDDKGKPPGEDERVRDALENSRLIRVADAGHYVHEEKPDEVAAAIIAAKDFWAASR